MQLKSIDIGAFKTRNNVFLAPLAGYTNCVFRQMCYDLGAGLTFTEMVSAKGLCYNSANTRELLQLTPEYGGIKAVQIFGGEPSYMRRAAESEEMYRLLGDIRNFEGVKRCYTFGVEHHFTADADVAERLRAYLATCGHRNLVIRRVAATIEDCYMQLEDKYHG